MTRQVEHTVTEEVTGVDIVQTQIRIAGGASLADMGMGSQEQVPALKGFAIQCRVTSEDPEQNFQVGSSRARGVKIVFKRLALGAGQGGRTSVGGAGGERA